MANEQNLIPASDPKGHKLTVEEQSMGGKASGKARRQRKTLREIGDMIGGLDVMSEKNRDVMKKAGISDEDMIRDVEAMFILSTKASNGDPRAMELMAKLRGQLKEQQSIEVAEVKPLVDLTQRKKNGETDGEAN